MRFRAFIIFFLVFGVLPDLYLCTVLPGSVHILWKFCICLPTLGTLICLPLIGTGTRYTDAVTAFSYLTFIFEGPKFFGALFAALCLHVFGLGPAVSGFVGLGVGLAVSGLFCALIFFVSKNLKVKEIELSFPSLPQGFDGLRICHLSDLHLGSLGRSYEYVRHIVDTTLSLKPELILFTGDLVSFESKEADAYLPELERLTAPMGIIAIRGNHDYLMHGPHDEAGRQEDIKRLLEMERGLGWKLLLNGNTILQRGGDSIAVAGVENISANPFFAKVGGDLGKALTGIPEGTFTILMSHDPTHWRAEVLPASGVELTLSGHTHGLPYKMAGLHFKSWRLRESGGVYTEGERALHVSHGLGSGFAFRLGGFPQIEIITLKR